jgi:hypothetical protein
MKRLFLLSFLIISLTACIAQIKVTESSSKRVPSWVNGLEKDYIIVVGSSSSIQDAQQNALNMVKERIVSSVAENVKTSSTLKIEEANLNNNISIYLENFATTTTTTSGPVPFLQGISLSKVEEFYWEKTENRSTKAITYNYHIKYPFPYIEMWKLVDEFKKRDLEMTKQLDDLFDGADKLVNLDDIDKSIGELRILADYFMDGRKDKANLGITRYRNLYNNIELVELESGLGELKYGLRLGDKFVETSRKPQVRSECARITSAVNNRNHSIVKYDFDNCYEDPENHLLVSYRFGNNTVQKKFFFDISADKASIFVNEPIRLNSVSLSEGIVNNALINITLVSKYQTAFTITKVELELSGQAPIVIDNIAKSFAGKGNHALTLNVNQPLQVEATTTAGKRVSMLSGFIHFRSDKTGEVKTYRIYNHSYTTNW